MLLNKKKYFMPTVCMHLTVRLTKHHLQIKFMGYLVVYLSEMLHVTGNGIMKYQLEIVSQIIESGSNKTKKIHQLDVLHQNLVVESLKQSERDMPRMSSHNGVKQMELK